MKKIILFINLIFCMYNYTIAQNKKEQIVKLNNSIDSIKAVIENERIDSKIKIKNQKKIVEELKNNIAKENSIKKTNLNKTDSITQLCTDFKSKNQKLNSEIITLNDKLITYEKIIYEDTFYYSGSSYGDLGEYVNFSSINIGGQESSLNFKSLAYHPDFWIELEGGEGDRTNPKYYCENPDMIDCKFVFVIRFIFITTLMYNPVYETIYLHYYPYPLSIKLLYK